MHSKLSLTFVCQLEPAGAAALPSIPDSGFESRVGSLQSCWGPSSAGHGESGASPVPQSRVSLGKPISPWWANTRRGRQYHTEVTFAPECKDVSLSPARPNSISGAPKLHSRGNPTKSICPFQYLEIIDSSRLRYYERKLLVKLFSPRSGWMRNFASTGDAERARRTFHISRYSQLPHRKVTGIHV